MKAFMNVTPFFTIDGGVVRFGTVQYVVEDPSGFPLASDRYFYRSAPIRWNWTTIEFEVELIPIVEERMPSIPRYLPSGVREGHGQPTKE